MRITRLSVVCVAVALQAACQSTTVSEDAHCVDLPLSAIDVAGCGAFVTAIRRGRGSLDVSPETQLASGDVVVLRGTADAVAKAETLLLK